MAATVAAAVLFATGTWRVPHTPVDAVVYDLVLYNVVPLGAAALCWRAAHRVPAERVPWLTIGATWAFSIVGNLLFALEPVREATFPSVADMAYLAAYPLIAVHLLTLVHVRVPRFRPTTWLDGAIGGLGVTAVVTTFVLAPSLDMAGLEANAATMTYPVADVLLLALLAGVIAVRGLYQDRTMLLVSLAFLAKLIGDVLLTRAQAQGGYVVGGPTDLCWVVAALLTAAAAVLARSPRIDADDTGDEGARTGWRMLALPLTCNVASLAVLAREWADPSISVGGVTALGCLLAALVRTAVTFQEMRSLHEMRLQAATDDLTGLPNRRALLHRLDQQLRTGRPAALLLLDLDGFKSVNDGLGHQAGDQLLQELGDRIRPALRPTDVLARLGGDEFAALLPDVGTDDARDCALRIHELVCRPVSIGGVPVRVGASIGVVTAPAQARETTDLLRCADAAMYAAKAQRGGVRVYAEDLDTAPRTPRPPSTDRSDRPSHGFRPLRLVDGRLLGVEAVARTSPSRGTGSVPPAPSDVLGACASWVSAEVPVWLELPTAELLRERLADQLSTALLRCGLPTGALVVRVRPDPGDDRVGNVLADLRARGIRTAIDVAGAGPLGLLALPDLPADWLRLPPQLTRKVLADPRTTLVVEHTIALAHGLGTAVLADGADDATTAWLVRRGCEVLSGESAVLAPDTLAEWLRAQTGTDRAIAD